MNKLYINMMMFLAVAVVNSPAFANTIYKCQGANGGVSYSQSPCAAGEQELGASDFSDLSKLNDKSKQKLQDRLDKIGSKKNRNAKQQARIDERIKKIRARFEKKQERQERRREKRANQNSGSSSSSSVTASNSGGGAMSGGDNSQPSSPNNMVAANDTPVENTPSGSNQPAAPESTASEPSQSSAPETSQSNQNPEPAAPAPAAAPTPPPAPVTNNEMIADTSDNSAPESGGGSPNATPTNTQTAAGQLYGPIEFEITSWPLTKAYPGLEYNIRLGVIGGQYPYEYTLESGPDGMVVDEMTGETSWTPGLADENSTASVVISVMDSTGAKINQAFDISVTKAGFYFVSPNGSDGNGNGSIGSPWKSMNTAIRRAGSDGILYLRGGTYSGAIDIDTGMSNKWIAFPGEKPVIDLQISSIDLESYKNVDYGYIDGIEFKNAKTYVFFNEGKDHWIFRRNHMHHLYDNSYGENPSFIFLTHGTQYTIVQDNLIHDLFDRGSGQNGDSSANYHGGASVVYDAYKLLYENNEIYNIDGRGIKDKDGGRYNTYRGNYIRDNYWAALTIGNQDDSTNFDVLYNVLVGSLHLGFESGQISNVVVRHNTIYGHVATDGASQAVGEENTIILVDNIISSTHRNKIDQFPMVDSYSPYACGDKSPEWYSSVLYRDNNLINYDVPYIQGFGWGVQHTLQQWQDLGFDVNSIFADPQFNNISNLDFRPKAGSPACGAALDGTDIGALRCVQ